jgi:omega-hydroxy-beta-dihydromenaquinone-9 sulfotransferase
MSVMEPETARDCPAIAPSVEVAPTRPRVGRQWAPRIWQGMSFSAWLKLAARNGLHVSPKHAYMPVVITVVSFTHSILRQVERLIYGRRIARTEIREAPIFIVGHWRTGTTLLHELLALDERFTSPTTYECLDPNHFLLTEGIFRRWAGFLMPAKRPMDNMASGWDRPQEDEFALCMLGQRSPYLTIAFPNHRPHDPEYLDLEALSPRQLASWKRTFLGFLTRITLRRPKRLVLKSPTHSCRIKTLLEMFPDARFLHIVRDPRVVVPSTVHLWKTLHKAHGLQEPTFQGLEERVFAEFDHLYTKLEEGKAQIDPSRFHEVRYETLVADPISSMRGVYDGLGLGGFDEVRPALEAYLNAQADYATNRYKVSESMRREIEDRCATVIERYGYHKET